MLRLCAGTLFRLPLRGPQAAAQSDIKPGVATSPTDALSLLVSFQAQLPQVCVPTQSVRTLCLEGAPSRLHLFGKDVHWHLSIRLVSLASYLQLPCMHLLKSIYVCCTEGTGLTASLVSIPHYPPICRLCYF
jgi:hypothetical protein